MKPKLFKRARVLLVEDDLINQNVVSEFLNHAGIVTEIAHNGREAVEAVANNSYDAVLIDIQMPDMDGLDATRMIRKTSKFTDLPIIGMSGNTSAEDKKHGVEAGMNDFITKPFKARTLFSKLQKWINPEKQIQITSSETIPFSIDRKSLIDTHKISDIEGIQLDKALLRLNGNKRLLAKILANFYEMAQHASIDIHTALSKKETKTAVRIVHSLKGAAGNISASQLQAAAQELENTIEKDDDSSQTALNHFERVLHQVLKSATRLLQLLPIEPQDFDNPEYSKDALLPLDVSNPAKLSFILRIIAECICMFLRAAL